MQKKSTAADDDDPLSLSSFQFGFISGMAAAMPRQEMVSER